MVYGGSSSPDKRIRYRTGKGLFFAETPCTADLYGRGKEGQPCQCKKVFEHIFNEDTDPEVFVREHGLGIVQNDDLMQRVVQKVLAENPGPLSELLGGKEKVFGFL